MKVGETIPSFTLTDQFGKDWNNLELAGCKTVLYAYPKDNTPGCTAEACDIRDNYDRFLTEGYRVFGISRDSKESHLKFAAKWELPFPLLSDPDHQLLEALGAWGEKKLYGKVSTGTIRKTFIFDAEGICTRIIEKVDTKNASAQILRTPRTE